eukprot:TRINITY_DN7410_c0_g1_i2.p2 TRINITY_DN7410_c0_g1~~TRINITY_DN7410_c0_g1_i2.p2  ORF type:complete len:110 (+),score=11.67 TRINITY_DN7410_c0_g1_i2:721-1050(+)
MNMTCQVSITCHLAAHLQRPTVRVGLRQAVRYFTLFSVIEIPNQFQFVAKMIALEVQYRGIVQINRDSMPEISVASVRRDVILERMAKCLRQLCAEISLPQDTWESIDI